MSSDIEKAVAVLAVEHNAIDPKVALDLIRRARTATTTGEPARSLVSLLLDEVPETDLLKAIAAELNYDYYDLHSRDQKYHIDDRVISRVDLSYLTEHVALPLVDNTGRVVVATSNPTNADLIRYMRSHFPEKFTVALVSRTQLLARLLYLGHDFDDANTNTTTVVRDWVDFILSRAAAESASDIHFRFNVDHTLFLRIRVDGALRQQRVPTVIEGRESEAIGVILARCATIDPTNLREPQDGTFSFEAAGRTIDCRVSLLPQDNGPSVVIRLLDPISLNRRLEDMGFDPAHVTRFKHAVADSQGCVIVAGPTGSGKPVAATATVLMGDGTRKAVGDLIVGDEVITIHGQPKPITAIYNQGILPVWELKTRSGRSVTAAADHPFLTADGWKTVDTITAGDTLANLPAPTITTITPAGDPRWFAVYGALNTGTHRIRFDTTTITIAGITNPAALADLTAGLCELTHNPDDNTVTLTGTPPAGWFRIGCGWHPPLLLRCAPHLINTYLTGVFSQHHPTRIDAPVAYARQLAHLLLRTGRQTTFTYQTNRTATITLTKPFTPNQPDPTTVFANPDRDGTNPTSHVNLLPDPVISKTAAGYTFCKCITVADDHTYTVNDLVTHNTTTLYTLMREVDAVSRNVLTAEDPVEYRLPYIGQTQIREDLGERSLTWSAALRSIVRQDPDVILVGEIRDQAVAEMAMQASITGHMVLTTVHAPDAPGVFLRLIDIGTDRSMVAEAVSLVISQRLIRKIHECATVGPPTPEEVAILTRWGVPIPETVPHPAGCTGCAGTGYRGRVATAEVLTPSHAFKEAVAANATRDVLVKEAYKSGWYPIIGDGLRLLRNGQTTVAELARVITVDVETSHVINEPDEAT